MLNLESILQNDRRRRAMTRLNRQAFEELLPSFSEAYQQSQIKPEVERKGAPGGGRKATLRTSHDKLFYILLYCKCYPTFDLMSVLFGEGPRRRVGLGTWFARPGWMEKALGYKQALPSRKVGSMEEFL